MEHFLLVKKCVLKLLWLFCIHMSYPKCLRYLKKKNYASGYEGRYVHTCWQSCEAHEHLSTGEDAQGSVAGLRNTL